MSGIRRLYTQPLPIGPNRHPGDQIRDAEAFCRRYLDRCFARMGHYERDTEYDDSLQMLITHLWRLGETFDPERNDSFVGYARSIIPKRAYDVSVRRILGRNGSRLPGYLYEPVDESTGTHRPGQALPDQPGDPDPDRGTDDRRIHAHRDSERARAAAILGLRTTQRAA